MDNGQRNSSRPFFRAGFTGWYRGILNRIRPSHPGTVSGAWIAPTVSGTWITGNVGAEWIAPTVAGAHAAPTVVGDFEAASIRGAVKPLTKE